MWRHGTAMPVYIQVPQAQSISCVQGIATAGLVLKYLTTDNPFLSNHINGFSTKCLTR